MCWTQDFRFALRTIRKRPVASTVIILTLGLGIGANTTFSASYYGMVLRPLPFADPERLVVLNESQPALGETRRGVSAANFQDWMDKSSAFAEAGAYGWKNFNFQSSEAPEFILGAVVSADLFPALGVAPALGRQFLPHEDLPGGPLVAMISHDIWVERFDSDPDVIGRTLHLDDEQREIVGVMPDGFHFVNNGRLWTPLRADATSERRDQRRFAVIARLAEGINVQQAQAAVTNVSEQLAEMYPDTNQGWSVHVRTLRDAWLPPVTQQVAAAQLILVGGVLLIVCANVTNMLLAQTAARRQERALRAVLGASRGRLILQTLVESSVLAMGGGLVGLLFASWGESWTRSLSPVDIPYWLSFGLNSRVLLAALMTTLMTGLLIGILPSLKSTGIHLLEAVQGGGARAGNHSGGWLRNGLVVAEYAVGLVILVSGLLMAKSFANLRGADQGFATEQVLTLRLPLTGNAYDAPEARALFIDEALRRLGGLAETAAVGATSALPISSTGGPMTTGLGAAGKTFPESEEPRVALRMVSRNYFAALEISRSSGRDFTADESRHGGAVAVISESLADLLWPGESPLGRQIRTVNKGEGPWLDVVGVVGDIEPGQLIAGLGLNARPAHQIYLPMAGVPEGPGYLRSTRTPAVVLKSRGAPANLVAAVRQELRGLDAGVPLFKVLTMDEVLTQFYFAQQIWSRMFSAIAFLALLIAAVGAYGVTAYSVSQRTREMGIRIALGAGPSKMLVMVVRQGFALAAIGVAVGLLGAVPMARAMETFLHDMNAIDPGVFMTVVGLLLTVGILASYLPARRAASVDPIVVLRNE